MTPTERNLGKSLRTNRTFYKKKIAQDQMAKAYQAAVTRQADRFNRLRALKGTHQASALEITYDDMKKVYAFNTDFLEYYAFSENTTMDMGVFDPELKTPQHWKMPKGLEFIPIKRKIVDPKTTPYRDVAPNATHCLFFQSPYKKDNNYQYYLLDEEGLYSVGEVMEEFDYTDDSEVEILPLPLDVNTLFYSGYGENENWQADGDTTWYSDTEYGVDIWYYMSEAFGTLETVDDGTIEVIKIAYQWWWFDYEVDEKSTTGEDKLLDWDNGTEIYFYSKTGHQLMISIDSLDVETTGLVKPDRIYYQKVQKSGTSVADNASIKAQKLIIQR